MPATPAWPPASTPRLFVDRPLATGEPLVLEEAAANYLAAVMRVKPGDPVRVFDDRTGEWLAAVEAAGRRRVTLAVGPRLRPRETVPDLWLLFAPIKKGRIDWLVEKATELGVARLRPVVTQRTVVDRPNLARLRAHMVEAAEQCDRTALPVLDEPVALPRLLAGWAPGRTLMFADESGGEPLGRAALPAPAAILTGPEGGFTADERAAIRALADARPISLGPRILRADTAALATVATWMALQGDWG